MILKGKKALITGGAKRVGAVIARALAAKGCHLILHYHRSAAEANRLAKELTLQGASVDLMKANLEREKEARDLAHYALKRGSIDILINNAALHQRTPFKNIKTKDWDKILSTNLRSVFLLSQKIGEGMRERGGRIINLADIAGKFPYRDYLPYCVSKGAVLSLTRALAVELAPRVQVNSISPGLIEPSLGMSRETIARLGDKMPLKQWGSVEEVAKAVVFLCESDYTTGANFVVDGGYQLV